MKTVPHGFINIGSMRELGTKPCILVLVRQFPEDQQPGNFHKIGTLLELLYRAQEMLAEIGLTPEDVGGKQLYHGRGCDQCNNTGYRGRTGLFEIMTFNDEIRDLIMENASTNVLRAAAQRNGMRLLRENGLHLLYEGITTIEEVARETLASEE